MAAKFNLGDAVLSLTADARGLVSGLSKAQNSMTGFARRVTSFVGDVVRIGGTIGAVVGGALGTTIKMAADFESAFAGVRKTVDDTEANFGKLSDGLKEMATRIPKSQVELAKIMETAGQLGVSGVEELLKFTETVAKLADTSDLGIEDAANQLARFITITQGSAKDIDRIGSAITALGNSSSATESDIVAMSLRLAGAGRLAGLTQPEILALATAMGGVGIEAEAGGSAMSKLIIDMAQTARGGRATAERLAQFAHVAGLSSAAMKEMIVNSPADALKAFFDGMAAVKERGENVFAVLEKLGFSEIRLRDTIMRTTLAHGELGRALEVANKGYSENNALTAEAEKRYATFWSQLALVWNNLKGMAIEFGTPWLKPLIDAFDTILKPALEKATQWAKDNAEKIKKFAEDGIQKLADGFTQIGEYLLAHGDEISQKIKDFGAAAQNAAPGLLNLVRALEGLGRALGYLAGLQGGGVGWLSNFGATLAGKSDVSGFGRFLRSITNVLQPFGDPDDPNRFVRRALGGPVRRLGSYMVGERGPEPFFPAQNGSILSRDDMMSAVRDGMGGKGGGVNFNAPITVVANNPADFFRQLKQYTQMHGA